MADYNDNQFEIYKEEAQEKWGTTDAYKEHQEKSKHYSTEKWNELAKEMSHIFDAFAVCMRKGEEPNSAEVQNLVKLLQQHITENYYLCTNEILAGLGQMYVADERFEKNIDKQADGTAVFVSKAIEVYCGK